MKLRLLLCTTLLSSCLFAQDYSRCKVLTDSRGLEELVQLGIDVDHGTTKKDHFFISDFSAQEIQTMRDQGFQVEILIADVQQYYVDQNKGTEPDPPKNATCSSIGGSTTFVPQTPSNFNLGSMGGYFTYQQFLDEIDAMAAAYPNLISTKAPISNFQTHEGRPIYWLRLSDNPTSDEAEPEVLYTALHHAREAVSLSQLIFYMWYLLENYDTNPEIKFLVDNTELYFVPMINPDGYVRNQTTNPNGGGMWRKNRRNNGNNIYGVDLNRNYSYGWGTTGISTNPSNDTYPGTGPFSEPETQAIKWLCEQRNFQFAFNAHSYSNLILFPIGTTTQEFAEDHDYFQAIGNHMVQFNGYLAQKSSTLYPASGDSDDYMYLEDLAQKPEIFAMTPEIGGDDDGFWPAQSSITGICQEMYFPNLTLAHLVHRYAEVKNTDPSTVDQLTGTFNHSILRYGMEDGVIQVQLQPITGIQSVGNAVNHTPALLETQTGSIAYTLDPAIQFGDLIQFELLTVYPGWTKRDTITKTFGALTLQVFDQATNTSNWTGNFALTNATFYSASQSFTDTPVGDYPNNANLSYRFVDTVDLTNATAAGVSFYAKWAIESDYDFARMEVSTDFGQTWTGQCGKYTTSGTSANGSSQPNNEPVYEGVQADWVLEEINLSDYLGEKIMIRFVLKSDGGVRDDGFFFDDFKLSYNIDDAGLDALALPMQIFPNPANDQVQVSLAQPIHSGVFRWFDQTGKLVGEEYVETFSNLISLATDKLPNGYYTLRLETLEGVFRPTKMIVIHP